MGGGGGGGGEGKSTSVGDGGGGGAFSFKGELVVLVDEGYGEAEGKEALLRFVGDLTMAREALLEGRLAAVRRSNMEAAKVLKEDEEDDGDLILLNLLDSAPCVATPNAAGGSGGGGGGGGGGVNKKAAKRAKEEVEQLSLQVTGYSASPSCSVVSKTCPTYLSGGDAGLTETPSRAGRGGTVNTLHRRTNQA